MRNTNTDLQPIKDKILADLRYYGPQTLDGIFGRCFNGTNGDDVRTAMAQMRADGTLTTHMTGNLWRGGRKIRSAK